MTQCVILHHTPSGHGASGCSEVLVQLCAPLIDTLLGHLGLILFIKGKPDELSLFDGIGLLEFVAFGIPGADELCMRVLQGIIELPIPLTKLSGQPSWSPKPNTAAFLPERSA